MKNSQNEKNDKIVVYNNDLNRALVLSELSAKNIDIFNAICIKMKNSGDSLVEMSFNEIKELSSYDDKHIKKFIFDTKNVYSHLLMAKWDIKEKHITGEMNLFSYYELDEKNRKVTIKWNKDFLYFVNDLNNNITLFNIEESNSLKSKYAKIQYRNLMEFKTEYTFIEDFNDFKLKMGCTNIESHNINKRILNPILNELSSVLEGLKLEKIRKGRNIEKLKWIWEKNNKNDDFRFFEKLFSGFEIDFNYSIQKAILGMKKKKNNNLIEQELKETWEIIHKDKKAKNPKALFCYLLFNFKIESYISDNKTNKTIPSMPELEIKKEIDLSKKDTIKNERSAEIIKYKGFYDTLTEDKKSEYLINAKKEYEKRTKTVYTFGFDSIFAEVLLFPIVIELIKTDGITL
ncbi:MAG: replication initiation protein [Fusobacteriaceae bacterium]|jgi:plasmid replication initiation protein|nr:replication initiation protein [Fusobacteriaceae bacterium]